MTKRGREWLIIILLAGLVLRLAWVSSRPTTETSLLALPDQVEYVACAKSILGAFQGESFGFVDARFGQFVYAQRTPGYPAFIALFGCDVMAVRVGQALVDVSTILAVFLIARKWMSERRALIAAAVVAINPLLVYFCGPLLTETLFTAMLAWSVYLLVNRRWLFPALFVLAAGVIVRPSGLPFAIILPLASGWFVGPGAGVRRGIGYALVAAMVMVISLLPWAARNRQVLGEWVWLSTNSGITLYDGVWEYAEGGSDQAFVSQIPGLRGLGEVKRDELFQRLANDEISKDPMRFGVLAVKKIMRTWSPIPLSKEYGSNRLYVAVGIMYCLPLMVLAVLGLWSSALPWQVRVMLILPPIIVTIMHAISVGSLRYRIPVEPLLAILAASTACRWCCAEQPDAAT